MPEIHEFHCQQEVDEFNALGIPKNLEETHKIMGPLVDAWDEENRKKYTWKILSKDQGQFLGLAGFTLSLDKYRLGEIFCKLSPSFWNKGYATEVSQRLINLGFDHFDLHKVEAGAATENAASIHVLEKVGMTREGLRRKLLPIRGEWVDNYHFGILEDDPRDY